MIDLSEFDWQAAAALCASSRTPELKVLEECAELSELLIKLLSELLIKLLGGRDVSQQRIEEEIADVLLRSIILANGYDSAKIQARMSSKLLKLKKKLDE